MWTSDGDDDDDDDDGGGDDGDEVHRYIVHKRKHRNELTV